MDNKEICHYGVLGMKWGVRKAGKSKRSSNRSEDSARTKQIRKKKIKQMSNDELKTINNRLQLEKQYKDLSKRTNYGKKAVNAYIKGATTTAAVIGATQVYKKYGDTIINKVGNKMVGEIRI